MDDFTDKQWVILQKFKDNVKDAAKPEYNDRFYARWLIAREFDLKKAEKMFRQSLLWRRKYGVDNILQWQAPDILRYYKPIGFHGEAKDGTPIYYFLQGRTDVKPLYYGIRKQDMVKLMARNFTYLDQVLAPAQSEKHGKLVDQMTLLYDFERMSLDILWKPYRDLCRDVTRDSDDNFPERLRRVLCINIPWFFSTLWNVIKPILSQRTKDKVIVLGSNWKKEILEYIEADQLPVHFGGTAPDPPAIPETDYSLCWGGKIPDKYKNMKPEIDISKFTTETVARGTSFMKEVPITVPGSIIEWQFWTEDHDIGFGVYRRTGEKQGKREDMETIIKCDRVNSHILPDDGSLPCDTAGTYVLVFDNSYSWTKSKTVAYCVEVFEPANLDDVTRNTEAVATHL